MILAINLGSSSVKFAVYPDSAEKAELTGKVDRIGLKDAVFRVYDAKHAPIEERKLPIESHADALKTLLDWLKGRDSKVSVVGHRIVHGGLQYDGPRRVTPEVISALKGLIPLAPEHLPQEIAAVEAVARVHAEVPQVVSFDTAFHRRMPREAQLYGLPRDLADAGIVRYGFHGLSYEYIAGQEPRGRVVAAHLGNGASLAAIRDGACVDTSMGFTPSGGMAMGTRSGDVDPAVILYLLRERKLAAEQIGKMVNEESGLIGISGISPDMQDLLAKERENPTAAEAIAVFCYQARKYIGAFATALGGLDTLVFAGGIGENAAPIRERICANLGFLGVRLDPSDNARHADVISAAASAVRVRVIRANEELIVARQAKAVLEKEQQ